MPPTCIRTCPRRTTRTSTHPSPRASRSPSRRTSDGGATTVDLYRKIGAGAWTSIASKTSNSSGNAYFSYTVLGGDQQLFAETSGDVETEVDTITGEVPVPQKGVLNPPDASGKNWTADFTPGQAGKATELQMQRTYTKETNEVNAADGTPEKGPWITLEDGQPRCQRPCRLPGPVQPVPLPDQPQVPCRVRSGHLQVGGLPSSSGDSEEHRTLRGVLQHQRRPRRRHPHAVLRG